MKDLLYIAGAIVLYFLFRKKGAADSSTPLTTSLSSSSSPESTAAAIAPATDYLVIPGIQPSTQVKALAPVLTPVQQIAKAAAAIGTVTKLAGTVGGLIESLGASTAAVAPQVAPVALSLAPVAPAAAAAPGAAPTISSALGVAESSALVGIGAAIAALALPFAWAYSMGVFSMDDWDPQKHYIWFTLSKDMPWIKKKAGDRVEILDTDYNKMMAMSQPQAEQWLSAYFDKMSQDLETHAIQVSIDTTPEMKKFLAIKTGRAGTEYN